MSSRTVDFTACRIGEFAIRHDREIEAELVVRAIAIHRENHAQGREACEHWAPAASVSRVVLSESALPRSDAQGEAPSAGTRWDFAVKWCRWRGVRGALSDAIYGSRASRSLRGAARLAYLAEMPEAALTAIDLETCLDAPSYTSASAGDVTRFNQTSAGALASQQWGDQAPARLGIMLARWDRMTGNLSDPDFRSLDAFITNKLSPRERAWVWTALAT